MASQIWGLNWYNNKMPQPLWYITVTPRADIFFRRLIRLNCFYLNFPKDFWILHQRSPKKCPNEKKQSYNYSRNYKNKVARATTMRTFWIKTHTVQYRLYSDAITLFDFYFCSGSFTDRCRMRRFCSRRSARIRPARL